MEPWEKEYDRWLTTDPDDWYNWYENMEEAAEFERDMRREEEELQCLQEAPSGPLG